MSVETSIPVDHYLLAITLTEDDAKSIRAAGPNDLLNHILPEKLGIRPKAVWIYNDWGDALDFCEAEQK